MSLWLDSKKTAKLKFERYLANGYMPYLGWNSNDYGLDGYPLPSNLPNLPPSSKQQEEQARELLRKQVDIMFAKRGKV